VLRAYRARQSALKQMAAGVVELDLTSQRLDSPNGLKLAEALATNTTLKALVLRGNALGDGAVAKLLVAATKNKASALVELDISGETGHGLLSATAMGAWMLRNRCATVEFEENERFPGAKALNAQLKKAVSLNGATRALLRQVRGKQSHS